MNTSGSQTLVVFEQMRRLTALAPRCPCRTFSSFSTTFPLGLTNASATDAHWATALDLASPLLLRRDCTADFMDAARADAEALGGVSVQAHLAGASAACDAFLRSGEVHDREETRAELQGLLEREGQLALLLGGKNVGKSLMLRELAGAALTGRNGQARLFVHINARTCGTNLLAVLPTRSRRRSERQRLPSRRAVLVVSYRARCAPQRSSSETCAA